MTANMTSMTANMSFQIITLGKGLRTLITLVWLLARVGTHMNCEVIGPVETLSTQIAKIWFEPYMISI